jgi:hypothetical protein
MTGNAHSRPPGGPTLRTSIAPILRAGLFASFLAASLVPPALAGGIQVSARVPSKADTPRLESTTLLVSVAECHTARNLEVIGRAEGLVNGQRRTVPLPVEPGRTVGEFEVARAWPADGRWVLVFEVTAWDHTRTLVVDVGASNTKAPLRIEKTSATWKRVGEKEVRAALAGTLPNDTASRTNGLGDVFARALGL